MSSDLVNTSLSFLSAVYYHPSDLSIYPHAPLSPSAALKETLEAAPCPTLPTLDTGNWTGRDFMDYSWGCPRYHIETNLGCPPSAQDGNLPAVSAP